jgi:hypothetical protein
MQLRSRESQWWKEVVALLREKKISAIPDWKKALQAKASG